MVRSLSPNWELFEGLSRIQRVAFVLLLIFVAVAPFPYGAVTSGGALVVQLFAFTICALSLTSAGQPLKAAWIPLGAVTAIAVLGAVQLIPLSPSAVERLSPAAATIYGEANELLGLFGSPTVTARLTIAPSETVRASLLILAYVALFVAAFRLTCTRLQRRTVLLVFLTAAALHVGYASLTDWSVRNAGDEMAERAAWRYADRLHGAFVNPNHFAGYLEIALMVAFALILTAVLRGPRRKLTSDDASALEGRFIAFAWRTILWAVIATGIALTKSRMGTATAVFVTLILFALALLHHRVRRRRVRAAMAVGLVLVVAAVIAGMAATGNAFTRFLASDPRDPQSDARFRLWETSVDAWSASPHIGFGLGAFREAFRRVQPHDLPGLVEQAHSDSLQMLVTGGWIGVVLAAAGLLGMLALLLKAWWKQAHREESAVALAAAGALMSLLLHGLAEFNFSIPAIPATLAVIVGVGWSAASYHSHEESRRSPEEGL